ncbi:hypothetical protein VPNG_07233 [Cytospora leucostoma]|uniref:nitrilase n=1 Tax=Cytospora leucostoma TaxID=1230097 RepID=A0A423WKN7_9PEZI|nr:hypothetical protein VPNG_07233 [Cytospora leucostoma]
MKFSTLATGIAASSSTAIAASNNTFDPENFVVAAVRQPPPNFPLPVGINKTWVDFDLNATISQAVDIIKQAQEDGVGLLAFPELYFPGYPISINTNYTADQLAQYVNQSLTINSTEWNTITDAFADAGIYGAFGFSEHDGDYLYLGQALIGPDGSVLKTRRKLRPSGTERDIWSDGDYSGLRAVSTDYGRIGLLECWEHFHPTMTFVMQAQLENIHIAAFPYAADPDKATENWELAELSIAAARYYSVNINNWVVMPQVGTAAIFYQGRTIAYANASDTTNATYITATVNTTAFSNATYNVDGEQSWGALLQLKEEWPAYIPKVNSSYFEHKLNPIESFASTD